MLLHRLLQRKLLKLGLTPDHLPETLEQWQTFLKNITQAYEEADQERYLSERSFQISSHELTDLNERLKKAQKLARLGYWHYNLMEDKFYGSHETYILFDYDPLEAAPNYKKFMERVYKDDYQKLDQTIKEAVDQGKSREIEIRYCYENNIIRWFRCILSPNIPDDPSKKIESLAMATLDVTVRKESEKQILELNIKLLDTARKAGMSEIATAILHNIGNVLNSVNVSVEIAEENMKLLSFEKLEQLAEMIDANKNNATEYFANNEKGKLIPEYLKLTAKSSTAYYKNITHELTALKECVHHIRDIITTQHAYAGVSGFIDKIFIAEAIEAALQISNVTMGPDAKKINVEKNYNNSIYIFADKSKLYQILVNLIQNARDAVINSNTNDKKILISVTKENSVIAIKIEDNGVGILPEKVTEIFRFGFTTKQSGHGIGLHSCALAAKEMGGSLQANSEGLNKGAEFILTLPINRQG